MTHYPLETPRGRFGSALVLAALTFIWMSGWIRQFLSQLEDGRATSSALGTTILAVVLWAAAACLILAVFCGLTTLRTLRLSPSILLLLLWALFFPLHGVELMLPQHVLFPLLALAWVLLGPQHEKVYALLAWLGFTTAAGSVIYGLIFNQAFMSAAWTESSGKGWIGEQILAGPYGHSNHLGLAMALSLPFVVWYFRRISRYIAFGTVMTALVWSTSRISLGISIPILLLVFVVIYARPAISRRLAAWIAGCAGIVCVLLPLIVNDPGFLNQRGRIWQGLRSVAFEQLWWGRGGDAFVVGNLHEEIRFTAFHGHNMFMTTLTAGGLVAVALLVAVILFSGRNSYLSHGTDPLRLVLLSALLLAVIAEDPLNALNLDPRSFLIWPILLLVSAPITVGNPRGRSTSAFLQTERSIDTGPRLTSR